VYNEHWYLTDGIAVVLIFARVKHLLRLKPRRIYVLNKDLSKHLANNIINSSAGIYLFIYLHYITTSLSDSNFIMRMLYKETY